MIVQKRLHAVYFKATQRLTNQEVGDLCDLHHRTVSQWVHSYKKAGITSLYAVNYGTNTSVLAAHKTSIVESLTISPVASLKEAKARIKVLTNIELSLSQIGVFLKRHDFAYRKLGHIPAKEDVEKQEQWLKKEPHRRSDESPN